MSSCPIDDTDDARRAGVGGGDPQGTWSGSGSPGTKGQCGRASEGTSTGGARQARRERSRRLSRMAVSASARAQAHGRACGRAADLPPRSGRRRRRLGYHPRHPRQGPPAEPRAIHQALAEALGAEPPEYLHHGLLLGAEAASSKRHEASSIAELRGRGSRPRPCAAYLHELALPRADVRLDLARLARLAVEAIAALPDEELAEAVEAPVAYVLRSEAPARSSRRAARRGRSRPRARPRCRRGRGCADPSRASGSPRGRAEHVDGRLGARALRSSRRSAATCARSGWR